jgi:acetate kinase
MKILVLNTGSSSLKSCLYELAEPLPRTPPVAVWEAHAEWDASFKNARLRVRRKGDVVIDEPLDIHSGREAVGQMLQTLWHGPAQTLADPSEVDVIGHRIVHGGLKYREPVIVTPEVKEAISRMAKFAPQHNPAELEGIEIAEQIFAAKPEVAVFDTAFHSTVPKPAALYPGPYEWFEQGIRRYGFQGISHQYCAGRAAEIVGREVKTLRLVTCHLGHGCSLAAVREGRSIDTTMGCTPLEGLMMANRSGSIDPGILIHLLREKGLSAAQLDDILNHHSGLLGVSGVSDDMRQILAAIEKGNSRAKLALDVFIHRLRFYIGAMVGSLGGMDALVFTAGIGENSPQVRAAACEGFEFLGVKIDAHKNEQSPVDQDIATQDSKVRVVVVAAREDWAIALECWRLVQSGGS